MSTPLPPGIVLLPHENYLSLVRGSVGANLFRHIFATVDGARRDLTEDGNLSCAFFVSCILALVGRIDAPHSTVVSTVRAMEAAGWVRVETTPQAGDILVWEPALQGGRVPHSHIGFAVGGERAISNDYATGTPSEHHWTYEGARRVEAIYRHPTLAP